MIGPFKRVVLIGSLKRVLLIGPFKRVVLIGSLKRVLLIGPFKRVVLIGSLKRVLSIGPLKRVLLIGPFMVLYRSVSSKSVISLLWPDLRLGKTVTEWHVYVIITTIYQIWQQACNRGSHGF